MADGWSGHEFATQDRELLEVLHVLTALCAGDFSARAEPREGLAGQVVARTDQLVALQERRTRELGVQLMTHARRCASLPPSRPGGQPSRGSRPATPTPSPRVTTALPNT